MPLTVATLTTPFLLVLAAAFSLAVIAAIFLYVRKVASVLLSQRQDLDKAVAAIDLLMKQRHDELPKLLSTARSYLPPDSRGLQAMSEARAAYTRSSNPAERGRASGVEFEAMCVLFKEAEHYPDLRLNTSFRQVRKRLEDLNTQIGKDLARASEEVRTFNQRLGSFPVSWVAGLRGIQPRAAIETGELPRPKA